MAARSPPPGIPGVTSPCQVPIASKTRRSRGRTQEPAPRWGDGPQTMLAPRNWAGHACRDIRDAESVQQLVALLPDGSAEVVEQTVKMLLDRAASGYGRDPGCTCQGWRTSVFRDALAQMGHPALEAWGDDGCEHNGNNPSLPELEDLRRGGIADGVLACAQRQDRETRLAVVGLYIAYVVALPPALLHHGAHSNFSKMAPARRPSRPYAIGATPQPRRCASRSRPRPRRSPAGASRPSSTSTASAWPRGRIDWTAGGSTWRPGTPWAGGASSRAR